MFDRSTKVLRTDAIYCVKHKYNHYCLCVIQYQDMKETKLNLSITNTQGIFLAE